MSYTKKIEDFTLHEFKEFIQTKSAEFLEGMLDKPSAFNKKQLTLLRIEILAKNYIEDNEVEE